MKTLISLIGIKIFLAWVICHGPCHETLNTILFGCSMFWLLSWFLSYHLMKFKITFECCSFWLMLYMSWVIFIKF